jgi:esterase/lipase superfamily enzyme
MRSTIRTFAAALLIAFLVPAAHAAALQFDDRKLVYTSDATGHTESELPALFDRLLADPKPLVLFIHGRGNEPQKSLVKAGFFLRLAGGGRAVHKLESYGANVVMISWESKAKRTDRLIPLSHMDAAQRTVASVLDAFAAARARRATALPQPQAITLLAHSMGTIVLQTYVDAHNWNFQRPLFTNVALTSADADGAGHANWVDKIAAVENVFITVNADDKVLRESAHQPKNREHPPLGREPGVALAGKASYITIRTKAHEIFAPSPDRSNLTRFFDALVKNERPAALLRPGAAPNQFQLQ